jgi:signal transduction histidine kinase
MIEQPHSQEISTNSAKIIITITAVIVGVVGLVTILIPAMSGDPNWKILSVWGASLLSIHFSYQLINREKQEAGKQLFLLSHTLLLAGCVYLLWVPGSLWPCLFSLLILVSGMIYIPTYPFNLWVISSILLIVAVSQTSSATPIRDSAAPIFFNLLVALFTFAAFHEWHFTVNSISKLHSRARDRRDELFAIQEELSWANLQLKELNKELDTARNKADAANEAKTKFLSNMSHELRTPLNAILNFTWFVLDELYGPINDEQKNALGEVMDSSEHLLSLINDVLDLNKIEAGMINLVFEEIEIEKPLRSMVSIGTGLVKDKPVELVVQIPEGLPTIQGDRRRIRQIFLNLISNAVKYTENGKVTICGEQRDDEVHISIKDTGIGIAEEDFDKVFETYRQAQHNLENVVSTGLGLPITKRLVELHTGQIWFESVVGEGSTFHISFPIANEALLVDT